MSDTAPEGNRDPAARPAFLPSLRAGALGIDIMAVMTSSAATGALGFVFWTLAARGYSAAEVGRASAIISSATLVAILATLSLGSLYERFLPLSGSHSRHYVRWGMLVVVAAALCFGAVFLAVGPRDQLFSHSVEAVLFPGFVAVLAIYAIQDPVLIGLGRARSLAVKNITQSVCKLAAVAALIPLATGSAIVWAWVCPAAVISVWFAFAVIRPETLERVGAPTLPARRELVQFFASSYAISAVGIVVPLLVPLIIVGVLGTETNAYFSMCWLVVNTIGVLIGATAAPFIATASTPGADLRSATTRFTLMSAGAAVAGAVLLLISAPLVLGIMGPDYAAEGTDLIRLMALTLPSVALLTIYTALARLQRRLRLAVGVQLMLGSVVVLGVWLTTPRFGINGVGYTYLTAELISTLIIAIPVARLLRRVQRHNSLSPAPSRPHVSETAPMSTSSAQPTGRPPLVTAAPGPIPDVMTVSAAFADVAGEHGDRVALHTLDGRVTYRELAAAAEGWAVTAPAGEPTRDPRDVVLMLAGFNLQSVAAVLGMLSAGRVLAPLDPALPAGRTDTVIRTLQDNSYRITALITDEVNHPKAAALELDCEIWPKDSPPSAAGVHPSSGVDTISSIQITSGSTGVPKAVLQTHGMWLADAELFRSEFGIGVGTRVAVCMPISFAAGLNILLGSLLCGAEVIAVDPRDLTAAQAFDHLEATGAEVLVCTPTFVQSISDVAPRRSLPRLRRVVTTGEAVQAGVVNAARRIAPEATFTNWVGSSETLAIATFDVHPGDPVPDGPIPAGKPAPHKRVSLDADGVVTVTSPYVAWGYVDARSATTRFEHHGHERSFITNDIGRWDADGNLVLRGRADTAVKIRGYLVEPAEIESALARHPDIREAVVVARTAAGTGSGEPVLNAYVAPAGGVRTRSVAEIRARLHQDLPAWMIPAHIMILAALPRTERGKVDRMALPEPVRGVIEPPLPGLESTVASIWAQALTLDEVGRTETFYELGGDSLTAAQILVRIKDRFGVMFTQAELAGAPTVAEFSATMSARLQSDQLPGRTLAPTTVVLRAVSSAKPPWFCFAGAGASALTFTALAGQAESDRPIYAFQPHGLENRGVPDWTVVRAARRHLTDLRRLQPHGPYTLIGHSLGGFIALEVARRLESLGDTVELVVLLDPFLPPGAVREVRRRLPDATLTLDAPPLRGRELWARRLRVPLAGIVQFEREAQAKALEEVGVRVGLMHRPAPWPGRTLLMLSHLNQDDPRLWAHILTGELQVTRVPGDHHSVIREPSVGEVARLIRDAGSAQPKRMSPITP
jgi:acyl-coenzyme A synthetase/AMP-(fatty) acid ligase/thioesterase domain-containing protein/O-antigen/teichoic acid export membrane protein/acyl carrier protein